MLESYFSPELEWGELDGTLEASPRHPGRRLFAQYDSVFCYFQILGCRIKNARVRDLHAAYRLVGRDVEDLPAFLDPGVFRRDGKTILTNEERNREAHALYLELEIAAEDYDRNLSALLVSKQKTSDATYRALPHEPGSDTGAAPGRYEVLVKMRPSLAETHFYAAFRTLFEQQADLLTNFYERSGMIADPADMVYGAAFDKVRDLIGVKAFPPLPAESHLKFIGAANKELTDPAAYIWNAPVETLFDVLSAYFPNDVNEADLLRWKMRLIPFRHGAENRPNEYARELARRSWFSALSSIRYHHVLFAFVNMHVLRGTDNPAAAPDIAKISALLDAGDHPANKADLDAIQDFIFPRQAVGAYPERQLDGRLLTFLRDDVAARNSAGGTPAAPGGNAGRVVRYVGFIAGRSTTADFPGARDTVFDLLGLGLTPDPEDDVNILRRYWTAKQLLTGLTNLENASGGYIKGIFYRVWLDLVPNLEPGTRSRELVRLVDSLVEVKPSLPLADEIKPEDCDLPYWDSAALVDICELAVASSKIAKKAGEPKHVSDARIHGRVETERLLAKIETLLGSPPLSTWRWEDLNGFRGAVGRAIRDETDDRTIFQEVGRRSAEAWKQYLIDGGNVWTSLYNKGYGVGRSKKYPALKLHERGMLTALRRYGVAEVQAYDAVNDANTADNSDNDVIWARENTARFDPKRLEELVRENATGETQCNVKLNDIARTAIQEIFGYEGDWGHNVRRALTASELYIRQCDPFFKYCRELGFGDRFGKRLAAELGQLSILENFLRSNFSEEDVKFEPQHEALAALLMMPGRPQPVARVSDFDAEELTLYDKFLHRTFDNEGVVDFISEWLKELRTVRGSVKDLPNARVALYFWWNSIDEPASVGGGPSVKTQMANSFREAGGRYQAFERVAAVGRAIGVVTSSVKLYGLGVKVAEGEANWRTTVDFGKYVLSITGDIAKLMQRNPGLKSWLETRIANETLKKAGAIGNVLGAILMGSTAAGELYYNGQPELAFYATVSAVGYTGAAILGMGEAGWITLGLSTVVSGGLAWAFAIMIVGGGLVYSYRRASVEADVKSKAEAMLIQEGILVHEAKLLTAFHDDLMSLRAWSPANTPATIGGFFRAGEYFVRGDRSKVPGQTYEGGVGRLKPQGAGASSSVWETRNYFVLLPSKAHNIGAKAYLLPLPLDAECDLHEGLIEDGLGKFGSDDILSSSALSPYPGSVGASRAFSKFLILGTAGTIERTYWYRVTNHINPRTGSLRLPQLPIMMPPHVPETSHDFEALLKDKTVVNRGQALFKLGLLAISAPISGIFIPVDRFEMDGKFPAEGSVIGKIERISLNRENLSIGAQP